MNRNLKPALVVSMCLILLSGVLVVVKDSLVKNFLHDPQSVEKIRQQTGQWQPDFSQPIFLNAPAPYPLAVATDERVLGAVGGQGGKWLEIDLSEQKLYAHEGDTIIYTFPVSTGKWAPTPTGEFRIWIKLRYSTMSGGDKSDGTYYYLPNVPYVMFFNKAIGLHGTYWHNNFGTPMSHGCVNLSIPDAEKLYWWTDPPVESGKSVFHPTQNTPGTRVLVHE